MKNRPKQTKAMDLYHSYDPEKHFESSNANLFKVPDNENIALSKAKNDEWRKFQNAFNLTPSQEHNLTHERAQWRNKNIQWDRQEAQQEKKQNRKQLQIRKLQERDEVQARQQDWHTVQRQRQVTKLEKQRNLRQSYEEFLQQKQSHGRQDRSSLHDASSIEKPSNHKLAREFNLNQFYNGNYIKPTNSSSNIHPTNDSKSNIQFRDKIQIPTASARVQDQGRQKLVRQKSMQPERGEPLLYQRSNSVSPVKPMYKRSERKSHYFLPAGDSDQHLNQSFTHIRAKEPQLRRIELDRLSPNIPAVNRSFENKANNSFDAAANRTSFEARSTPPPVWPTFKIGPHPPTATAVFNNMNRLAVRKGMGLFSSKGLIS